LITHAHSSTTQSEFSAQIIAGRPHCCHRTSRAAGKGSAIQVSSLLAGSVGCCTRVGHGRTWLARPVFAMPIGHPWRRPDSGIGRSSSHVIRRLLASWCNTCSVGQIPRTSDRLRNDAGQGSPEGSTCTSPLPGCGHDLSPSSRTPFANCSSKQAHWTSPNPENFSQSPTNTACGQQIETQGSLTTDH
jgi:hypothetical protein